MSRSIDEETGDLIKRPDSHAETKLNPVLSLPKFNFYPAKKWKSFDKARTILKVAPQNWDRKYPLGEEMMTNPLAVYENNTALRQVFVYFPEVEYSFELVANVIGVFSLSLAIYFFLKLGLFHINLTSLLINMMVSYLIRTLFRIPIVIYNLLNEVQHYQEKNEIIQHMDTVCAICQYVCGADLCLIFLERLYATNKAKVYESQSHYWTVIPAIVFLWLLIAASLYLSSYGYISILTLVIGTVILMTICGVGMIYLLALNHKLYRNKVNTKTNLSYRYQVTENIRSFRMLLPMLGLLLVGCVLGIVFYSITVYVESPLIRALGGITFTLMVSCGSIVLPVVALFFHRTLRQSVLKVLQQKQCQSHRPETTGSSAVAYNVPMTLNGKKLILGTNECTAIYFQQIQQMWN